MNCKLPYDGDSCEGKVYRGVFSFPTVDRKLWARFHGGASQEGLPKGKEG